MSTKETNKAQRPGKTDPEVLEAAAERHCALDGNRIIGVYDTWEAANEAVRVKFEKRCPGVPFTPEGALHGKDEQGRTLWSFGVISILRAQNNSSEERIKARRPETLERAEKLYAKQRHAALAPYIADVQLGRFGEDLAVRATVDKDMLQLAARHPQFLLNPDDRRRLQARSSCLQTRLRLFHLGGLAAAMGEDYAQLMKEADALRDEFAELLKSKIRCCPDCRKPYVARDCQDTGLCPACAAAVRQKEHRQKQAIKRLVANERPAKARPKYDAMTNLQLASRQTKAEEPGDPRDDGSAYGGESLIGAKEFQEWKVGSALGPGSERGSTDTFAARMRSQGRCTVCGTSLPSKRRPSDYECRACANDQGRYA